MKKSILSIFLSLLIAMSASMPAFAATEVRSLQIVTAAVWEDVYELSEGLVGYRIGASIGYADKMGANVIGPINALSLLTAQEKMAYDTMKNTHGYDLLQDLKLSGFHQGFACISGLTDRAIYINRAGQRANLPVSGEYDFYEGYMGAAVTDDWDMSSSTSSISFPFLEQYNPAKYVFISAQANFSGGLATVCYQEKATSKLYYGYYNTTAVVLPPVYENASRFSEGVAAVTVGGKVGVIDTTGKYIIEPTYDTAVITDKYTQSPFSEGLARVTKFAYVGVINKNGVEVNICQWNEVAPHTNGLSAAYNGKWGYINDKGALAVNPKYDDACNFGKTMALVGTGGVYTLIDRAGKQISGETWSFDDVMSIGSATDEMLLYEKNGKYGLAAYSVKSEAVKAKSVSIPYYAAGKSFSIASYLINGQYYVRLEDAAASLQGTTLQYGITLDGTAINLTAKGTYTQTSKDLKKADGKTRTLSPIPQILSINGVPQCLPLYGLNGETYVTVGDLVKLLG